MLTTLVSLILKLILAAVKAYITIFLVLLLAKIVTALFFGDPLSRADEIEWTELPPEEDEGEVSGADDGEVSAAEEETDRTDDRAEADDEESDEEEDSSVDDDAGIVWTPARAKTFYIAWVVLTLYYLVRLLF